ncbi:A2 inhibitor and Ly6 PLAUR domain-containing [Podarcis lilfordi]|uniref:A2 inhibitor and Ly6 PLAUR domain-containing n=1 Tax=Podarcis lilfordi TaxID=74358 RepID=A0AA35P9T6_9SAUR|nr:A2 inhibitor and Ly6 PLAUR domain-containing [Podarcis lilfordi]
MSAVASLKCQFCWTKDDDCENTIQECNEDIGQLCISSVSEAEWLAFGRKFVYRSCANGQFCQTGYSRATVTPNMYMVTKTYCCDTDMCNSEPFERKS